MPTLFTISQIPKDPTKLREWISLNRSNVHEQIDEHGAVLLRTGSLKNTEDFQDIVQILTPNLLQYTGGGSPRTKIEGSIYTSTEYVSQVHIPLHCEMSYTASIPRYINFFCQKKAETGGSTPIGTLNAIEENLPANLVELFRTKGVRYTTFLNNGRGFGKSWQQTYETEDKDEVSQLLSGEDGLKFEWLDDGLFVERTQPSHRKHSRTGEDLWYNQAVNWHPAHLGVSQYEKLLKVFGEPDKMPKMVSFGDGSPIDYEHILAINEACEKSEELFEWENGDLLLLDNERVAHGRHSFEGERSVLVAMAND